MSKAKFKVKAKIPTAPRLVLNLTKLKVVFSFQSPTCRAVYNSI